MANDDKIEPKMGSADDSNVDEGQPTIGRINVETPTNNNDGWLKYMTAANATGIGSVIAFALAAVLFFPLGYYTKYKQVRNQGIKITQQAAENSNLDTEALVAMESRHKTLNESLKEIGFDDDEIAFLNSGERSKFDTLKEKFTKVIPGETITKYLPGKTVTKYVPRQDCENDYLGDEASNAANQIIIDGFKNRASQQ